MLMKMFYFIRVSYKMLKRRYFVTNSFCKVCGREVSDFSVADVVWGKVDKTIKRGHILCYDCFCKKCEQLNLPTVWELKDMYLGGLVFYMNGVDELSKIADISEFSKEAFEFTSKMGWTKSWIKGGCYINLESSEFIEALKGKCDPVDGLGDLLITIFSVCENYNISITDGIDAARKKMNKIMVLGEQNDR